jgi:molybdopterin-binding protein
MVTVTIKVRLVLMVKVANIITAHSRQKVEWQVGHQVAGIAHILAVVAYP